MTSPRRRSLDEKAGAVAREIIETVGLPDLPEGWFDSRRERILEALRLSIRQAIVDASPKR